MDTIQRKAEFTAGLKVVKETISMDKNLRLSLQCEIGKAFHDAYEKDGGRRYKTLEQISVIAHEAADNFLTLWCKE